MAAFFSTPFRFEWREQRREVTLQRTPMFGAEGDPVPRMQPNQQFSMRGKHPAVFLPSVRGALNMDGTILLRGSSRAGGAEAWLRLIIREAISIDSLKELHRALRQLSIVCGGVRRISVWDPCEARFRK